MSLIKNWYDTIPCIDLGVIKVPFNTNIDITNLVSENDKKYIATYCKLPMQIKFKIYFTNTSVLKSFNCLVLLTADERVDINESYSVGRFYYFFNTDTYFDLVVHVVNNEVESILIRRI